MTAVPFESSDAGCEPSASLSEAQCDSTGRWTACLSAALAIARVAHTGTQLLDVADTPAELGYLRLVK